MSMSSTEVGLTALIKLTAFAQPCRETDSKTYTGSEEKRGRRSEGTRRREITHLLSSLVHHGLALTVYVLGAFSINKCLYMRQSTAIKSGSYLPYSTRIVYYHNTLLSPWQHKVKLCRLVMHTCSALVSCLCTDQWMAVIPSISVREESGGGGRERGRGERREGGIGREGGRGE